MELIQSSDRARQLARAIASDIAIYNQQKIREGLKGDNLFELLEKEIFEGKLLYESQVSPDLAHSTNFFNCAIVDVLLNFTSENPPNIVI